MKLHTLMIFTTSLVLSADAWSAGLSKAEMSKLEQSILYQYEARIRVCETLNWNENAVCMVEADGQKSINQAELQVSAHPSARTRCIAWMAHVDADYNVAITRCNDVVMELRQACWQQAADDKSVATANASKISVMCQP